MPSQFGKYRKLTSAAHAPMAKQRIETVRNEQANERRGLALFAVANPSSVA